jgi:hypothetical protein
MPTVSASEALDVVIGVPKFSTWLKGRPETSWSAVSIFPQYIGPEDAGIVPSGPSWEIDVIREEDGVRDWAIGFVDPATGNLRSLSFCNDPCDR